MTMETIIREAEDAIIGAIIDGAIKRGWSVSVCDGISGAGDWVVQRSTDRATILAALRSTDADTLRLRDLSGASMGSVFLIYGNSGWDVVADHSVTLDGFMELAVQPVIDEWEAKVSQADHTEV